MSYTVDEIISEYVSDRGENDNKRKRFYGLAVKGLRRFTMQTSGVPKVVELFIDHADFATLPTDYMQYTKIALSCNGVLYSLGLNNSMSLHRKYNACGKPIPAINCNCNNGVQCNCGANFGYGWYNGSGWGTFPELAYADTMRNGEFMGRMFGIGSDNNVNGYYRIDKNANQILFGGLCRTSTVILEYVSDITMVDGDFPVHPYCIEALHAYIRWQLNPDNVNAERIFKDEAKAMRLLFGKFTIQEWEAAIQSGNTQAPKLG